MIKLLKSLFGKRQTEPLPEDVVAINSALDKLRAAITQDQAEHR
jgi:hypothetical protein